MTEKELKKLSRSDHVEMLMEQTTRVRELEDQLEDANRILERRDIAIDEAGSIAEAALKLNGVFEAAQAAGEQYLENIRNLSERQEALCARREEESMKRAEKILEKACVEKVVMEQEAKVRCAEMVARAKTESQAYWTQISQRLEELGLERAELKELLQQMPKE